MVTDTIDKIRCYIDELENFDVDDSIKENRDDIIKKFNIALLRLQKFEDDENKNVADVCTYLLDKTSKIMDDFRGATVKGYVDNLMTDMGISEEVICNDELINKLIDEAYEEVNKKFEENKELKQNVSETVNEVKTVSQATKGLADWLNLEGDN